MSQRSAESRCRSIAIVLPTLSIGSCYDARVFSQRAAFYDGSTIIGHRDPVAYLNE
jgi:hypothetical protein